MSTASVPCMAMEWAGSEDRCHHTQRSSPVCLVATVVDLEPLLLLRSPFSSGPASRIRCWLLLDGRSNLPTTRTQPTPDLIPSYTLSYCHILPHPTLSFLILPHPTLYHLSSINFIHEPLYISRHRTDRLQIPNKSNQGSFHLDPRSQHLLDLPNVFLDLS